MEIFYSKQKPPYEKTRHTLIKNGKNLGHFLSDTIFIRSIPHIVLEWVVYPDGTERPAHPPIPLDPAKHQVLDWADCKYMYELPVEDPGDAPYTPDKNSTNNK